MEIKKRGTETTNNFSALTASMEEGLILTLVLCTSEKGPLI